MASSKKSDGIEAIPQAEIDEIISTELEHGTILSTNTVYEDRTIHPVIETVQVPTESHEELENGTVVTHYGMPAEVEAEAE